MPRLVVLIAAAAALVSFVPFDSLAHADTPPAVADGGVAGSPRRCRRSRARGARCGRASAGRGSGPAVTGALGDTPVWKLARGVYGDASLRPAFDEAHARALAGEAPAAGAPADVRDLAETRAAIHGDDGASSACWRASPRSCTCAVSSWCWAHRRRDGATSAKVFLAGTGQFDAASYAPDASGDWSSTVSSLSRAYGMSTVTTVSGETTSAPAMTLVPTPPPPGSDSPSHGKPFYYSPWFWGAVGAAALGGVAVYFATRDSDPSTIHLQLQVPK